MTFLLALAISLCSAHPTLDNDEPPLNRPSIKDNQNYITNLPLPQNKSLIFGKDCYVDALVAVAVQAPAETYTITFTKTNSRPEATLKLISGWATIDSQQLFDELCQPCYAPLFKKSIVVSTNPHAYKKVKELVGKEEITFLAASNPYLIDTPIVDILFDEVNKLNNPSYQEAYFVARSLISLHGLQGFQHLKTLDLACNHVKSIAFVRNLKNLEEAYFSANKIENVEPLLCCPSLKILDLSSNQISDFRSLGSLPKLETLTIYNNPIANVDGLEKCSNLKYVNAQGLNPDIFKSVREALPDCFFKF